MNRRSAQLLRGLGSLLLLALVLIGPPVALAALVGWPLPTTLPDLGAVELAWRSGVSDDVIVKTLALVAWVAWLQIAVAVAAEVIAVLRGRPALRLPVLPGIQPTVGRLVASIAMMSATFSPVAFAGNAALPTPALAAVAAPAPPLAPPPSTPSNTAPPTVVSTDLAPATATPTVTVERHDSYWAIAERTLGDGYRWREVRDLNVGHTMNTGHVIEPGGDLLLPGWVLELPADATPPASATPPALQPSEPALAAPSTHGDIVVEPGDSFWVLAERQLATTTGTHPSDAQTAPYWQQLVDANQERLVQPGNPNLIVPGQHLTAPAAVGELAAPPGPGAVEAPPGLSPSVLSGTDGPAAPPAPVLQALDKPATPEVPAPPPPVVPQAPTTTVTSSLAGAPTSAPDVAPEQGPPETSTTSSIDAPDAPIGIAAAGLASAALAVGATRAVRRRRRRTAHRAPTAVQRPESETDCSVHRALIDAADEPGVDELRAHLGDLARGLADAGSTTRPRVVQWAPDHLDVFLAQRDPNPPAGWRADADGAIWSLESLATRPADPPICAAPLLVTLGQPDEGGQLFLDLEAERLVSLAGDEVTAYDVARAVVAELALTPLADNLEILVVGDGLVTAEATSLDHVTVAAAWDEITDDLHGWIEQTHAAAVENGWPNAFVGRGHALYHDALAPVIAFADEAPPDTLLDHLRAHPRATLVVVTLGALEGACIVDCQPDMLTLVDVGLVCAPYPMEPEFLDAVIDLVTDDEDLDLDDPDEPGDLDEPDDLVEEGVDLDEDPFAMPASALIRSDDVIVDLGCVEPDYDVLVRVLGEIRVEGGEALSPKQTAVVTYIALHETVSGERLQDAVWSAPSTASRRKRLANTISECRAAIGRRHLPTASDGRYRIGPGITTDLQLFELRVKRAVGQNPAEAADTLLSALDLVTGPLFTYRSADRASFAWVEVENWISTWELTVADAAQRCADLLIDVGRTDEAVDVALQALRVIPTHTGLTETLMRSYAAAGDRLAVRRVFDDHVGALQALDLDEPAESTIELLERLRVGSSG